MTLAHAFVARDRFLSGTGRRDLGTRRNVRSFSPMSRNDRVKQLPTRVDSVGDRD